MTIRHVMRSVLVCNGCTTEYGAPEGFATAMEVRAQAYNAGWRFPARVKANGAASSLSDDVCPDCITDWSARPAPNSWAPGSYRDRSKK